MSKSKRILRDVVLFAIASFGPKIVGFLLVPLYTDLLSTEVYGTVDFLNTIYALLLPVLTLDISDAILIYTAERIRKEEDPDNPFQLGMTVLLISSTVLLLVLAGVSMVSGSIIIAIYCGYIFMQYVNHAYYNNFLAYLRATEQVGLIVTTGIISSVSIVVLNVLFILVLRWGVYGFIASNILGVLLANIFVTVAVKRCKRTKMFNHHFDKKLFSKMLKYSAPLIPNGIAWWINSSSDRFIVTFVAGVSLDGIYAVAAKIPTILTACHSVIYQALQINVIKEVNEGNDKSYLNKLYNLYNALMVLAASCLIILDIPLAKLLYKKDFFVAWHYVPALLISTVLYSVAGYVITIAEANKKSSLIAKANLTAAMINTILNLLLIPRFKLYGAVIATIVGYFILWFLIVRGAKKSFGVNFAVLKSCFMYLVLLLQWLSVLYFETFYWISSLGTIILLLMNVNEILTFMSIAKKVILSKFSKKKELRND